MQLFLLLLLFELFNPHTYIYFFYISSFSSLFSVFIKNLMHYFSVIQILIQFLFILLIFFFFIFCFHLNFILTFNNFVVPFVIFNSFCFKCVFIFILVIRSVFLAACCDNRSVFIQYIFYLSLKKKFFSSDTLFNGLSFSSQ